VTTLELAGFLEELAKILRRLPESSLDSASRRPSLSAPDKPRTPSKSEIDQLSFARMSKYTKKELFELIEENQIPVSVRAKDSAENVLKRLQRYLQENSQSKRRIRNQVAHGRTSPELTRALSYLLKDRYE
jgi:hypothetical protein